MGALSTLLPMLSMLGALGKKKNTGAGSGMDLPGPGSPDVLLSQDIMRRRTANKPQTTFAGGMNGMAATIGRPSLWGIA